MTITYKKTNIDRKNITNYEYHKEYQKQNKERLQQQKKEYYINNRDKILKNNNDYNNKKDIYKVKCECGSLVDNIYLNKHKQTKKHQKYENPKLFIKKGNIIKKEKEKEIIIKEENSLFIQRTNKQKEIDLIFEPLWEKYEEDGDLFEISKLWPDREIYVPDEWLETTNK